MIASSVNALHAVWLDPFSPLGEAERAQLDAAGVTLECVATLGEMNVALRRAHVLVVRLGDSADLLLEVQTLIAQLGHVIPVMRARLLKLLSGANAHVKAATAIRVAISHYIVRSDDDGQFLAQLRHAVGIK